MCTKPKPIQRNWDNGKIIAIVSLIENSIKFSFAVVELVFGHFRNASPSETRAFIHSILFTVIGFIGIICSVLLYTGITNNKKYNRLICWICLQGISIFHQMFFSIEIFALLNYSFQFWAINLTTLVFLILLFVMEVSFLIKILKIYQAIVEVESPVHVPSTWRVPTVSELLGDAFESGRSTPPMVRIHGANLNTSSCA